MPIAKSDPLLGRDAKPMPGWIVATPLSENPDEAAPMEEFKDPRMAKLAKLAEMIPDDMESAMMMNRTVVSAIVEELGDKLDECPYSAGDKIFYTSDRGFELGGRVFLIADRPFAWESNDD